MATTTFRFDKRTEQLIDELRKEFSASSRSEVMRKALALLELARMARRKGQYMALVDEERKGAEGVSRILLG